MTQSSQGENETANGGKHSLCAFYCSAKRAESNQVLAKLALLAMALQHLNKKRRVRKIMTAKKKGTLILILKTFSTTFKSTIE